MTKPPAYTEDPWIDAYLRIRQAFLNGATVEELTGFADELKRSLPGPTPHHQQRCSSTQTSLSPAARRVCPRRWSPRSGCLIRRTVVAGDHWVARAAHIGPAH